MSDPKAATEIEISIVPDQERVVVKLFDENENLVAFAKLPIASALQAAGHLTLGVERIRSANTVQANYRRVN